MSAGFQVTVKADSISVKAEAFTLDFDKSKAGISSFRYETSGIWHECVEKSKVPSILYCPVYKIQNIEGEVIYPDGGHTLLLEVSTSWFIKIIQAGYLRNSILNQTTNFPYSVDWSIWASGRIFSRMKARNNSGSVLLMLEESYRLNPADDPDISLGRDNPPELNWFGFFSDNRGSNEFDLSHDGIVVPYQSGLDNYAVDSNTNRVYRTGRTWFPGEEIARDFMIRLSCYGSAGDCVNAVDFQMQGDAVSSDYGNPDPLDGSPNAGLVIKGLKEGYGFSESLGAYRLRVQ